MLYTFAFDLICFLYIITSPFCKISPPTIPPRWRSLSGIGKLTNFDSGNIETFLLMVPLFLLIPPSLRYRTLSYLEKTLFFKKRKKMKKKWVIRNPFCSTRKWGENFQGWKSEAMQVKLLWRGDFFLNSFSWRNSDGDSISHNPFCCSMSRTLQKKKGLEGVLSTRKYTFL